MVDDWLLRLEGLIRAHDHDTSIAAAEKISHDLKKRQQIVYDHMATRTSPISHEQLEEWPGFADIRNGADGPWSMSTARKRCRELVVLGRVEHMGYGLNRKGNRVKLWGIPGLHVAPDPPLTKAKRKAGLKKLGLL